MPNFYTPQHLFLSFHNLKYFRGVMVFTLLMTHWETYGHDDVECALAKIP